LEWLQRMTNAVDYIEEHLEEPIEVARIAEIAYSSSFHFQRMFHILTGNTVVEYIRKRRLTLAARELAEKKAKVIDIALKYGYETPEAFTKAFKRLHGVSPAEARRSGISLKAFPRISMEFALKGNQNLDYKIVEREAFRVVGKALRVSTKDVENFKRIPQFWKECNSDGTCEKLCRYFQATEILGVCMDMEYEKEQFVYMIAAKKSRTYTGSEFVEKTIPASNWAVFTSIGPLPNAIQRVWEVIFQEWFPATGYEHAVAPELEIYSDGDMNGEDYQCEVWIPIVKK
jgi:AraC family transcriptional regulator